MDIYNPNDNYCQAAKNKQSVLDAESTKKYLDDNNWASTDKDIEKERLKTMYSCDDNYQMGTIQDNQIYIATTNPQHDQIINGETPTGLSGYFSDQATVYKCLDKDGNLDNTKYNEACQIAPWRKGNDGDASYKPHVDCFEIDRDKLYENYGTRDFNAAIAKCEANNQFGAGGGNQGYNPYISEMIENGSLKHVPEKSYTDYGAKSENSNLINSTVKEENYEKMMGNAQTRAQDCVNNNTPHPSPEARNNGFNTNNAIKVEGNTGNATTNTTGINDGNSERDKIVQNNGGGSNAPPKTDDLTNAESIKANKTANSLNHDERNPFGYTGGGEDIGDSAKSIKDNISM